MGHLLQWALMIGGAGGAAKLDSYALVSFLALCTALYLVPVCEKQSFLMKVEVSTPIQQIPYTECGSLVLLIVRELLSALLTGVSYTCSTKNSIDTVTLSSADLNLMCLVERRAGRGGGGVRSWLTHAVCNRRRPLKSPSRRSATCPAGVLVGTGFRLTGGIKRVSSQHEKRGLSPGIKRVSSPHDHHPTALPRCTIISHYCLVLRTTAFALFVSANQQGVTCDFPRSSSVPWWYPEA